MVREAVQNNHARNQHQVSWPVEGTQHFPDFLMIGIGLIYIGKPRAGIDEETLHQDCRRVQKKPVVLPTWGMRIVSQPFNRIQTPFRVFTTEMMRENLA